MGGTFSKPKPSNGNRVSIFSETTFSETYPESSEDIKVPDNTSKHKSKSQSLFSKTRSFIGYSKSSSVQASIPSSTKSELDQLKLENETLKLNSERVINELNIHIRELNDELTKLRNEVKVLNTAMVKVRGEKDKSKLAETVALERAKAFEKERDKINRQFKLFREGKEKEFQTLIRQREEALKQLRLQQNDTSVKEVLVNNGELGLGRTNSIIDIYLDNQSVTGDSFFEKKKDSVFERDVLPFEELKANKDVSEVLKKLLSSLLHIAYSIPTTNNYTIYLTSSKEMRHVAEKFIDSIEDIYLQKCDIFIAFISGAKEREYMERIQRMVEVSSKLCIIGSADTLAQDDLEMFRNNVLMPEKISIFHSLQDNEVLVEKCSSRTTDTCKFFSKKQVEIDHLDMDLMKTSITTDELGLQKFDTYDGKEQTAILNYYNELSHENFVNIEEDIIALNQYVEKDGPLQPLLYIGSSGVGKSFILSHWISYLQHTLVNTCILYHFVVAGSTNSQDPLQMMQRFVNKLRDEISKSAESYCFDQNLQSWLDRASNKFVNGIFIIIDNADMLNGSEGCLNFLLDPLPVRVRVVVSVLSTNYPKHWDVWPSIIPITSTFDNYSQYLQKNLAFIESSELILQQYIETSDVRENVSKPLYCYLIRTYMKELSNYENHDKDLKSCLSCSSLGELYIFIINQLQMKYGSLIIREILLLIHVSRNGLSLMELFGLVSEPLPYNVCEVVNKFVDFQMIWELNGLIQIQRLQVQEAIASHFASNSDKEFHLELRSRIIQLSMKKLKARYVSYRVADELPWQLMKINNKDALQECLENLAVFIQFYQLGKFNVFINYWRYLKKDINEVHQIYMNLLRKMENESVFDNTIPILYDLFGEFMQELGHNSLASLSYERSLELKEVHYETDDKRIGNSFFRLGRVNLQWKKNQTSEDYLKQALVVKEQNNDTNDISYLQLLECLAIVYLLQDKTKDAEAYKKEIIVLKQTLIKATNQIKLENALNECLNIINEFISKALFKEDIGDYLAEIGLVYFHYQKNVEALALLTQALEFHTRNYGTGHPIVADAMCRVSYVYQVVGDYDKAIRYLKEAIEIFLQSDQGNTHQLDSAVARLVQILRKRNKLDQVEDLYRRLIQYYKNAGINFEPSVARICNELAVYLCKMNRYQEAAYLYEEALRLYDKHYGFQHPLISEVLSNFGKLYNDQRNQTMANHLFELAMNPNRSAEQILPTSSPTTVITTVG